MSLNLLTVVLVATMTCGAAALGETVMYTGYLADRLCVDKVIAPDGANMISSPEAHTVMCALLPSCAASGFTILMQKPGAAAYGTMHNLSASGNAAALTYLNMLPDSRNDLLVTVTGVTTATGLDVTGFVDASPVTIFGHLVDIYCIDNVIAPNGANMITNPQGHSVKCALLSYCIASGYTILEAPAAGATSYSPMHNLTWESDGVAVAYLRTLPDSRKNILVAATGSALRNGTFHVYSLADAAPVSLTGYLADRYCLDKVIAPDGANMITGPEAHSVMCALLAKCIASGFTLLMHAPGQTAYGAMYNFTGAGNAMAEGYLRALPDFRKNILVTVTGTPLRSGLFAVASVADAAQVSHAGYLADRFCVDNVTAPDGANMITSPERHTVMCSLLSFCVASGFTILMHTPGQTAYGAMYNLTAGGNAMAVTYLRSLPVSQRGLYVTVTGTTLRDGNFAISSLAPSSTTIGTIAPPVASTAGGGGSGGADPINIFSAAPFAGGATAIIAALLLVVM
jgi:hypothetical protein